MKSLIIATLFSIGLISNAFASADQTTNVSIGAKGETACSTDTASCSLNQLLQRIAQRITTLIGTTLTVSGTVNVSNLPTTVDTNSGVKSASTPRVVIATDQPNLTTPLNENVAQINGVTPLMGNGVTGTGSQRVTVASDNTAFAVIPAVGTTGGATPYFVQPAASDNHVTIKAGAGTAYGIVATNNSVTTNYLRLYNATTGFNGCNSATNLLTQVAILPSGGISVNFPVGMAFTTGLSICVTSGYATTDTTNATASAMSVTVLYN